MLALCLLVYKCLLNEKRLSGVFLPVLRPLPPRVTGFSLVAAGRTKGLETRARLPMPGSAPQLSGCSMESSFLPYLMAVMWMSFLLLLSVWLRAKVTFLQKYLVPAGIIAGFGFAFGPGQALSVGMSWQNDYGLPDCVSMGLAYAAAGFMVANFVGVPLANWGLRKGYATYGTKELSSDFLKGLRPEDKRVPACQLTTHSGNVDTFALHFAVAATVYGLGWIVCYVLKYFVLPPNYQTASFGFIYLYALFAGMIVRLVINHTAANAFYSDDAQNRILGTTIDYMIISALMAVSAATVMKYFIPFILVIAVCTLITLLGVLYLGRRVGSFGLERLLVVFGLVTGTAASGLALLRIVDSDFKTPAAAEVGLNNVYALIPLFPFLLLSVTMPGGFGISGMLIMHVVMIAVCAAILFAGHRMKIWGPRQF